MRKEPFTVGDYVHVYNRGNRKMPIVYDENDKWRFLKSLRYFNDEFSPPNLFRQLQLLRESGKGQRFEWPSSWGPHRPLVKILAYCLMLNHFHLLLKEIATGGISKFMKKLGNGFTNYINIKYDEVGSLFQGSYKARTATDERGLQYFDAYIQVFNPFELYPGGMEKALKEFDKAFEFVLECPFCSLGESLGKRKLYIVERDILKEMLPTGLEEYKEFVRDALVVHDIRKVLGRFTME